MKNDPFNSNDHESNLPAGDPIRAMRESATPDHGPNFWAGLDERMRQEPTPVGAAAGASGNGRQWAPMVMAAAAALVVVVGVAGLIALVFGSSPAPETITVNEPDGPSATVDEGGDSAVVEGSELAAPAPGLPAVTDLSQGRALADFAKPPRALYSSPAITIYAESKPPTRCMEEEQLWATADDLGLIVVPVGGQSVAGRIDAFDVRESDGKIMLALTCAAPTEEAATASPNFGALITAQLGPNRTIPATQVAPSAPLNPGLRVTNISIGPAEVTDFVVTYDDGTVQRHAALEFPSAPAGSLLYVPLEDVDPTNLPVGPTNANLSGPALHPASDRALWIGYTDIMGASSCSEGGLQYFVLQVDADRSFGGWLVDDGIATVSPQSLSPDANTVVLTSSECGGSEVAAADVYRLSGDQFVRIQREQALAPTGPMNVVDSVRMVDDQTFEVGGWADVASVDSEDGETIEQRLLISYAVIEQPDLINPYPYGGDNPNLLGIDHMPAPVVVQTTTSPVSPPSTPVVVAAPAVPPPPPDTVPTLPTPLPLGSALTPVPATAPSEPNETVQGPEDAIGVLFNDYQTAVNIGDVAMLRNTYSVAYRSGVDRQTQEANIATQTIRNWTELALAPISVDGAGGFAQTVDLELLNTAGGNQECQRWQFTFVLVLEDGRWLINDSEIVGGENPRPCAQPREVTGAVCAYAPESGVPNLFGMRSFVTIFESGPDVVVRYEQFGNAAGVGQEWKERVFTNQTIESVQPLFDGAPVEFDLAVFGTIPGGENYLWPAFKDGISCE